MANKNHAVLFYYSRLDHIILYYIIFYLIIIITELDYIIIKYYVIYIWVIDMTGHFLSTGLNNNNNTKQRFDIQRM